MTLSPRQRAKAQRWCDPGPDGVSPCGCNRNIAGKNYPTPELLTRKNRQTFWRNYGRWILLIIGVTLCAIVIGSLPACTSARNCGQADCPMNQPVPPANNVSVSFDWADPVAGREWERKHWGHEQVENEQ